VVPGQYTSTETVPAGWVLTGVSCDDGNSTGDTGTATATFNVEPGETVKCTFENTKQGLVTVFKTTNEVVDPTKDISFTLYDSTETELETLSTLNDVDGLLEFTTFLVPGDTYTMCENPVPAGYTAEFYYNGQMVDPYSGPPGAENPTGEVQCYDFTVVPGETGEFMVENSFPGGAPRTPGYWKNWNVCSGGNQAATAEALGGAAEGVYILENLLPKLVGDLTVDTCEVGILVLDARKQAGNNKKMSSDAAYGLARDYLAAQLNLMAGACVAEQTFDVPGVGDDLTFEQVLMAAQELLVAQEYNGTANYLGPKDKSGDRQIALTLAGIIDDYNNEEFCDGTDSH
jgi:hypothetical protein